MLSFEACRRFGQPSTLDQPARSLRDEEQQHQEQQRRTGRDGELEAPQRGTGDQLRNHEIADVGGQNADHDVDLKQPDQRPAPLGGRGLGDVHRCEHRRASDRHADQEPEHHK